MSNSVFSQATFWLMLLVSVLLPIGIYWALLRKRAISRNTVLLLGVVLVLIAGMDVYFLQILASAAKLTPSLADDAVFISEISAALYLLPVMFGGIGVNLISHVLIQHLLAAERRFLADKESSEHRP